MGAEQSELLLRLRLKLRHLRCLIRRYKYKIWFIRSNDKHACSWGCSPQKKKRYQKCIPNINNLIKLKHRKEASTLHGIAFGRSSTKPSRGLWAQPLTPEISCKMRFPSLKLKHLLAGEQLQNNYSSSVNSSRCLGAQPT